MRSLTFILLLFVAFSCKKDPNVSSLADQSRNVIVFVIDGSRYSETWGDSTHQYIPYFLNLTNKGCVFTDFSNEGMTNTVNGHIALCTGSYDTLVNNGSELPRYASFMQYWLKYTRAPQTKAWVITTKDKLAVLANCSDPEFNCQFTPATNSGISGLGSGYSEDSTTAKRAISILQTYRPKLMVINLKQPDAFGHAGVWANYLQGITDSDRYLWQFWNYLQSDTTYQNKTDLFITNDHGRHLDNVNDGFVSHGDACAGCRHINLLAIGPDFKDKRTITEHYSQIDVAATIAHVLKIQMPHNKGKVIKELFK